MKSLKTLALLLVMLLMCACLALRSREVAPPFKFEASSPQGTYAVRIERRKHEWNEKEPWTWQISLSFAKHGQQALNEDDVSVGDFSTNNWLPDHPRLNWVNENTFRLSERETLPESECDLLFIRNDTSQPLSYLMVRGGYGEGFFILDLHPQTSVKLLAFPQWKRTDLSWVSADGQFVDGRKVSGGQNFKIPASAKGPGRYCFSIKEGGITITSRDFEGWEQAALTAEERRKIEEYGKKLEARHATEADEKAMGEIFSNRAEIITPKSPDCGENIPIYNRR